MLFTALTVALQGSQNIRKRSRGRLEATKHVEGTPKKVLALVLKQEWGMVQILCNPISLALMQGYPKNEGFINTLQRYSTSKNTKKKKPKARLSQPTVNNTDHL